MNYGNCFDSGWNPIISSFIRVCVCEREYVWLFIQWVYHAERDDDDGGGGETVWNKGNDDWWFCHEL